MRHLVWIAALAAAFGAGGAAAQTSSQAAAPQPGADAQVQANAGSDAKAGAATAAADPTCLKQTGSRISARGKRDCAGHGRSYDRKELERTGQTDVGQALRRLDPRLR